MLKSRELVTLSAYTPAKEPTPLDHHITAELRQEIGHILDQDLPTESKDQALLKLLRPKVDVPQWPVTR
jgi:hypothetical protein